LALPRDGEKMRAEERHMNNPSRLCPLRIGLPLFGALLAGALLSTLLPTEAPAQDYPNRPITMIVPFAAGGLTDVPARVLAAMWQERTGQTIVVENKPGGSGTLGGGYAVRAAPDGCCSPIRSPIRRICISSPCPIMRSTTSP
jgi:hypothetical protein